MSDVNDISYMRLALKLAKKGVGYVNPNPPVGAVIVKDGKILSTGYHKRYGDFHAERNAILDAFKRNINLDGSTMYVTLEPCDHYGKTPPCTDLIIQAGIKKVVVATRDPNPVSGNGIDKLRNNGIEVEVGILENQAKELMKFFIKYITKKTPYVTLKYASTLDGKIADRYGNSKWITNELRKMVHRLRKEHMAVLVGANTVLMDNPQLSIRLINSKKEAPIKVILDRESETLKRLNSLNVFSKNAGVIVFTAANENYISLPKHVKVINCIDPEKILKHLYNEGIDSVLIEGGSESFSQFLPFADEIYGFYGLKVLGEGKDIFSKISVTLGTPFDFSIKEFKVSKNKSEFLVVMQRCSQG